MMLPHTEISVLWLKRKKYISCAFTHSMRWIHSSDFSIKSVTATYQTSQEESNTAQELRQGKELCNEDKALVCLQTLGAPGIAM